MGVDGIKYHRQAWATLEACVSGTRVARTRVSEILLLSFCSARPRRSRNRDLEEAKFKL